MSARLLAYYGKQHWWPAESNFEVIVGAFLTQNTNWTNVEKAMGRLRAAGAVSVDEMRSISVKRLEELVRASGYFRQKTKRLKNFIQYLDEKHGGSLERMFATRPEVLRGELLSLNGVGPETADSILSYAGQHEIFVVDAYTRRIFERHGVIGGEWKYDKIRQLVEEATDGLPAPKREKMPRHLPSPASGASRSPRARTLQELHAVMVRAGNEFCRSKPKCELCPLRRYLSASVSI